MTPLDAIVLAGGPHDAIAAREPGAPNKAFVRIAGVALVERTLRALRAAPEVGRIVVVAPPRTHGRPELALADACRADGATMTQSLQAGLADADLDALALVVASDLPILSTAAIAEFVGAARARDADLAYACVERRIHVARYPDVPHTWATLRDGTYCGGGCVALRPRVLDRLARVLGRLGEARKNPVRLAAIFGPEVLVRYAVRRLTLARAERRASELLGAPVAAVSCVHPEIAVNVDRVRDVERAERLIAAAETRRIPSLRTVRFSDSTPKEW